MLRSKAVVCVCGVECGVRSVLWCAMWSLLDAGTGKTKRASSCCFVNCGRSIFCGTWLASEKTSWNTEDIVCCGTDRIACCQSAVTLRSCSTDRIACCQSVVTLRSCSRHGVVAARLTSERPGSVIHSFIYSFIHSAVCLTTDPWPLPKRVLHRVRSSASSFNFQRYTCFKNIYSTRSSRAVCSL
jgi:hypothetical protein